MRQFLSDRELECMAQMAMTFNEDQLDKHPHRDDYMAIKYKLKAAQAAGRVRVGNGIIYIGDE